MVSVSLASVDTISRPSGVKDTLKGSEWTELRNVPSCRHVCVSQTSLASPARITARRLPSRLNAIAAGGGSGPLLNANCAETLPESLSTIFMADSCIQDREPIEATAILFPSGLYARARIGEVRSSWLWLLPDGISQVRKDRFAAAASCRPSLRKASAVMGCGKLRNSERFKPASTSHS